MLKKDAFGHLIAVTKTAICVKIKKLIASLQQEMELPEKYQTPDWLFEEQEQPEVDLEKEVENFCLEYDARKEVWFDMTPRDQKMLSTPTWSNFAANIARHFYELGKIARKEENK